MPRRRFGISTHLVHGQRLQREHLLEIAAHGFTDVELFATRTHIDYHAPAAVADLQGWLAQAGLHLHSVHAPVADSYFSGRWGVPWSLASANARARDAALVEAEAALHLARRIPFEVLVVHLGLPKSLNPQPGDNNRDQGRRSLEELQTLATPLGVTVAAEIIQNDISRPASLAHMLEAQIEVDGAGICLDVGHAHLMPGGVVDAIETASGYLTTVHLHDNRGRHDDHLLPFDGTIEWAGALTALQKVGYDGPFILEVGPHGSVRDTLQKARKVRERLEKLLE